MTDQRKEIQRKVNIKEFEWYQVETKVRELLTQILQPFIKKQTEESIKINELRRGLNTATQKLDDHQFLLSKQNAQKPTYIQIQDDKIQELDQKLLSQKFEQESQIKEMKKILEIYEEKIKQLNQLQTKIENQSQERAKTHETYQEHVNVQIDLMLKKLDGQDGDIINFRTNTRNNVAKLQTKVVVLDNRLTELESEMKRRIIQIRKINEEVTRLHQKTEGHNIKIDDLTIRISDREKDEKLSQKFFGKAVELSNELSFLRTYLTHYQPLYNQMQLSETLHSIIRDNMKIRLCLFEERAYAQIHNKILTMQGDSLEERMGQFTTKIRRIINKNKKYVIKLKVEQTVKYGTNIYEIREIDEKILKNNDNVVVTAPPPPVIPEEQISKMVEAKWQKLSKRVQDTLNEKTEPLKVWVTQMQEQSLMRSVDSDKKVETLRKDLEKQITDFQLHQTNFKSVLQNTDNRLNSLQFFANKHKDSLRDLINFSSVLNHIVIQDQIDRQRLALYALKPGKGQQSQVPPNIRLDDRCLSCADPNSSGIVNQAFKMACLAYNPSEIKIDSKVFSREEIFQISTGILERLKKKSIQIQEVELQKRSKSLQKSVEHTRNESVKIQSKHQSYRTIDSLSRRKDKETMLILPTLGSTARKKFGDRNTVSVLY